MDSGGLACEINLPRVVLELPNWRSLKLKDGRTYYYNIVSGIATWIRPTGQYNIEEVRNHRLFKQAALDTSHDESGRK